MATTDKNRSLITETPLHSETETRQVLTDALTETKIARNKALLNDHNALVDAFGPKLASQAAPKTVEAIGEKVSSEDYVTELDIDELIKELEGAPEDDDMVNECKKGLWEAKASSVTTSEKERMYRDIHRKFWAYAKSLPSRNVEPTCPLSDTDKAVKNFLTKKHGTIQWISHEGSIVMSALAAVSDTGGTTINLSQLLEEDQNIVKGILGNRALGVKLDVVYIFFRLDEFKNFDCRVPMIHDGKKEMTFTLGNRVASIPPHEAKGSSDVKIERKGKDIVIGDRIKLEKNRIQNLVSPADTANNGANRGLGFQPRQKVSGRNAYEIRADILEMALDFAKNTNDKKLDTDDVLDIAEAFYSFVEHK